MNKAYKYRIYPNEEQQQKMQQFFGCVRLIYNKLIEWYKEAYKEWKTNKTPIGKAPLVTSFKDELDFLKDCDNAALAYARTHFERAISDFFKSKNGKRKGKKLGFPKFKSKHKSKFTYKTCDAHGTIRFVDGDYIRLPKIGFVKCNKHRDCEGAIKAVTVEKTRSGKYYISVMVECDSESLLKVNKKNNYNNLKVVGLDMSMDRFVVSSEDEDNTIIKYVRNYRKNERRIKKLNRRVSKKQKGSANRTKAKVRLATLHEKISNRRTDFVNKSALYFVRKYDVVVLEDINLQSMARTLNLGKSVNDLGFGQFRCRLEDKAIEYDTTVFYADKWFPSSKTCSHCGSVNKGLRLSDREWVCQECGAIHNRDINAATNLKNYFINQYNTAGTAEIYACGDNTSTLRSIVAQVLPLKQEAPFL